MNLNAELFEGLRGVSREPRLKKNTAVKNNRILLSPSPAFEVVFDHLKLLINLSVLNSFRVIFCNLGYILFKSLARI